MPTLLKTDDSDLFIDFEELSKRHVTALDWMFEYDIEQIPTESSQRKRIFGGTYYETENASLDGIPARAVEYAPEYIEGFGKECASLAKANAVGAGPRVLQIHKCQPLDGSSEAKSPSEGYRAVIIEEDVGVNLEKAIMLGIEVPGTPAAPLHPLGTPERDIENAKIEFDVFSQLHNLHSNGMFHRDLRAANVCVRRYGERPQDIRATLIDFELIADVSRYHLEAAAQEYFETIFGEKTFLLPIEIDMGYLAAFCFELETGRHVWQANPHVFSEGEIPFFKIKRGTISVRRITQQDLDRLAKNAQLIPVNRQGMQKLTGARYGLDSIINCVSSLIDHGGYLDAKDIEIINDDPEYIILSNLERMALESFETYKAQVRAQGGVPDYEDFYDQPEDTIDSALDNIIKYRAKAESFGYRIVPEKMLRDQDDPITSFSPEELERLAKLEHDRWMNQKIDQGFVWGEVKDTVKKTHPDIVPYEELDENERDKDRRNINNMIPFLHELGLAICR